MAKPRIFISSTFYDLRQIRSDIDLFIEGLGYEPIRNEEGDIPYGKEDSPKEQAHQLFTALRKLDDLDCQLVYAKCPKSEGFSLAVYNRMIRAAGFEVQKLD